MTLNGDGFIETEAGLLPVNWNVAPLSQVVDFSRKPRNLNLKDFSEIPFIPMSLIPDNGVNLRGYEMRKPGNLRSGSYCEKGDILLAKITPSFENGKQAVVNDIPTHFAYATTEIYAFKPKRDAADAMFLFHFFRLPNVRKKIAEKMEGTTGRQRVPKSVIENYPIPLPPLPEQRRIAVVLNATQDAIAAQEDVIAAARQLKRSLMQRLFTYGPYREPAATKETEIGEIPAHWEVVDLGSVLSSTQYGMNQRAELQGTYPILRMNNLVDGRVDVSNLKYVELDTSDLERFVLNPNDVVFNRTNSYELVGKTGIFNHEGPYVFASYLVRVIPDTTKLQTKFLNFGLNYERTQARLRKLATRGVSQSNISPTKLKRLEFELPPLEAQDRIVDFLETADAKIAAEEDRLNALQALFKSMLHQLMTGRIRLLSDAGLGMV